MLIDKFHPSVTNATNLVVALEIRGVNICHLSDFLTPNAFFLGINFKDKCRCAVGHQFVYFFGQQNCFMLNYSFFQRRD